MQILSVSPPPKKNLGSAPARTKRVGKLTGKDVQYIQCSWKPLVSTLLTEVYNLLLETGSLDNAIREISLA